MKLSILLLFTAISTTYCIYERNYESSSHGSAKSIAVKGKLKCGNGPAAGILVVLFPKDAGSGLDPPERLGEAKTDTEGKFLVSGTHTDGTPVDAVLKFYHACNDDKLEKGLRKVTVKIPSDYVTDGRRPLKTFDTGTVNLELGFPGEERQQ